MLWVDDDPEGNRAERRMLQAFGVMVDTARTNPEALRMLGLHQYNMVITDIARGNDADDGKALATDIARGNDADDGKALAVQMQSRWASMPVIFYIADLKRELGTPAYGFGITNRPDHLLHYVVDVVARWRRDAARR